MSNAARHLVGARRFVFARALCFACVCAAPAAAQDSTRCAANETVATLRPSTPGSRRLPFAAGEVLEYSVSVGPFHVGSGSMRLTQDTVRGVQTWKGVLATSGGLLKLRVNDTTTSWFDTVSFNSLRFMQHLNEPRYHAQKDTHIFAERSVFRLNDEPELPSVPDPMDDVSLVYFVRSLPLHPGQCWVLHRYYRPAGNPVVLHVVKRESVKVPAGTFNTVLVRPEISTKGLFAQDGHAEVWISDDSARVVVQMKTGLPVVGSINLYLKRIGSAPPK